VDNTILDQQRPPQQRLDVDPLSYGPSMTIGYDWRGGFGDDEVSALHAVCFGREPSVDGWSERLHRHSLGWVCARAGAELVGFLNVAWDGGVHAFVLDTMAAPQRRRSGIGSGLVAVAAGQARAAGCEWLHVDFEEHLRAFYLQSCGFTATEAGLIRLRA
jgi:GNAT superfamily N-acetyltransferase